MPAIVEQTYYCDRGPTYLEKQLVSRPSISVWRRDETLSNNFAWTPLTDHLLILAASHLSLDATLQSTRLRYWLSP